jgi:16S rRNA (uracil1498-N3)-methyltransferase
VRLRRFSFSRPGPGPSPGDIVALDQAQSHQALTVLRLPLGLEVELTGPWGLARASLDKVSQKPFPTLWVKMLSPFAAGPPAAPGPTLALSLIKGQRFDWAVEKATELGSSALVPILTGRGNPLAAGEAKKTRWRRLSEEARKQCGRPNPMDIRDPATLENFLGLPIPGEKWLLDPGGEPLPIGPPGPVTLLVGPEGGLTGDEKQLAIGAGFAPFGLGPLTLRSETAAITALARLLPA